MINTKVAEYSGFCYGVKRAVDMACANLAQDDVLYCCGMLVHNDLVMDSLCSRGMVVVDQISQVPRGSKVLIRAHGAGRDLYSAAEQSELTIIDATCPSVAKIHRIADRESGENRLVVIVGNASHPEVIGIAGWCSRSLCIGSLQQAEAMISAGELQDEPVSVVIQTTMDAEEADRIISLLRDHVENIRVFNTVCHATRHRQDAARKLASESHIMLVIGSRKSSNTQKLLKICTEFCKNSFLVENVEDIHLTFDSTNKYNVGIVAGASTPSWVIKEVTSFMDQINKDMGEMNFAEEIDKSFVTLKNGQVVKGTVIGKDDQGVIVNVGFKSDGIVSYSEYSDDPNFTPDQIEIGTEIEVKVLRVIDAEGVVVLSKKRVDQQKYSLAVEEAYNSATPIQATVTETVNGGVIAMYGPVRIFIPASQVTSRRVKNFDEFVGNTYDIKIIEYKKPRKIIGSIRAIVDAKRREAEAELWANIEEGKEYTGIVKNLTSFGAFVDIGGVDGLIHLPDLSWLRIHHANQVLKTGDEVKVFVKDFNPETKKISLGYRRDEDNPWANAETKYAVGNIVTAKVMRMVPFGVFVEIVPGVDALVHISQISSVRIPTPEAALSIGQIVEAKVIEADFENKKINLSIKAVAPIDPKPEEEPEDVEAVAEPEPAADSDADETVIEI